jgi:hypothetical protein
MFGNLSPEEILEGSKKSYFAGLAKGPKGQKL